MRVVDCFVVVAVRVRGLWGSRRLKATSGLFTSQVAVSPPDPPAQTQRRHPGVVGCIHSHVASAGCRALVAARRFKRPWWILNLVESPLTKSLPSPSQKLGSGLWSCTAS